MRLISNNKIHYQQIITISIILFLALSFSVDGSVTLKTEKDSIKIDSVSSESADLFPLHEIASYYKADFQWDSIHEKMKLSKDDFSVSLTLGNPHILVNDSKLKLLSAPPNMYQGIVALSAKDSVSILSDLIPSMIFDYNEKEATITTKNNPDYKPSKTTVKPKTDFDDNISDEYKLPGNFNLRTVVIDAGHGGHDPGANRAGVREKDIVLDVAKRLGKLLEENTTLKVVLTRDTDVFIPLSQRTTIANRYQSDSTLFVSLHVNASPSRSGGNGTETYVFDLEATDAEARALAKRENEGESMDLTIILSHCYHAGTEIYSLDIARKIQRAITSQLGLKDRGVKRAPFYVLAGTKMPAILVELAFISNSSERARMQTTSFRQQAAEALFDAIIKFKGDVDKSLAKSKLN